MKHRLFINIAFEFYEPFINIYHTDQGRFYQTRLFNYL